LSIHASVLMENRVRPTQKAHCAGRAAGASDADAIRRKTENALGFLAITSDAESSRGCASDADSFRRSAFDADAARTLDAGAAHGRTTNSGS
jgi:hypothetical protein